jgi:hypothetical protein
MNALPFLSACYGVGATLLFGYTYLQLCNRKKQLAILSQLTQEDSNEK